MDKVVAVSRAGFTQTAERRARTTKIVPLTLSRALATDWPEAFRGWTVGLITWHFKLAHVKINYATEPPPPFRAAELKDSAIRDSAGLVVSTLDADVLDLYQRHAARRLTEWGGENLREVLESGPDQEWLVDMPFKAHDRHVVLPDGTTRQIDELVLSVIGKHTLANAQPDYYAYNGARVATAIVQDDAKGERYDFTLLFDEAGMPKTVNVRRAPSAGEKA